MSKNVIKVVVQNIGGIFRLTRAISNQFNNDTNKNNKSINIENRVLNQENSRIYKSKRNIPFYSKLPTTFPLSFWPDSFKNIDEKCEKENRQEDQWLIGATFKEAINEINSSKLSLWQYSGKNDNSKNNSPLTFHQRRNFSNISNANSDNKIDGTNLIERERFYLNLLHSFEKFYPYHISKKDKLSIAQKLAYSCTNCHELEKSAVAKGAFDSTKNSIDDFSCYQDQFKGQKIKIVARTNSHPNRGSGTAIFVVDSGDKIIARSYIWHDGDNHHQEKNHGTILWVDFPQNKTELYSLMFKYCGLHLKNNPEKYLDDKYRTSCTHPDKALICKITGEKDEKSPTLEAACQAAARHYDNPAKMVILENSNRKQTVSSIQIDGIREF